MSFAEIKVSEINENFIKNIGDEWMLITAGNKDKCTANGDTCQKLCILVLALISLIFADFTS